MSLDTRGVQIANGSKNPDDEQGAASRLAIQNWQAVEGYTATGELTIEQSDEILPDEGLGHRLRPGPKSGQTLQMKFQRWLSPTRFRTKLRQRMLDQT